MTLSIEVIDEGLHHMAVTGPITIGSDFGEVPALGLNQLLRLRCPLDTRVFVPVGFEPQFYILAKSLDGSVSDVRLDAVQFEYDTVSPILRLRADVVAIPAPVFMLVEAHHSVGR